MIVDTYYNPIKYKNFYIDYVCVCLQRILLKMPDDFFRITGKNSYEVADNQAKKLVNLLNTELNKILAATDITARAKPESSKNAGRNQACGDFYIEFTRKDNSYELINVIRCELKVSAAANSSFIGCVNKESLWSFDSLGLYILCSYDTKHMLIAQCGTLQYLKAIDRFKYTDNEYISGYDLWQNTYESDYDVPNNKYIKKLSKEETL